MEHTQVSYPVGHLATMYWPGLRPGDVHLNISSPGWAKHAWSCFFAPWIAEATIFVYNYRRFDPAGLAVPKAYIALAPGYQPTKETAKETAFAILEYAREHLAPFQRVRRLEFFELPKTISGKIRRVELRARETAGGKAEEWRDDQFPGLRR